MSKPGGSRGTNRDENRDVGKPDRSAVASQGESEDVLSQSQGVNSVQYGETPLGNDAYEFLTPAFQHLKTQDQLNEAEATNIAFAYLWLRAQAPAVAEILDQFWLKQLHGKMFGQVWTWAGRLRQRETNIGVPPHEITERWQVLLGNVQYWCDNGTFEPAEICVRLHQSMLAIHCFTNGNGRHARLTANKLGEAMGLGPEAFTWGANSGLTPEDNRLAYLAALRQADDTGEYTRLLDIALS